jgi:hypothetical protein
MKNPRAIRVSMFVSFLVAVSGGLLAQPGKAKPTPKPQAAPEKAEVRVAHAYSVCKDGFWHVVTDTYYGLPGGALQRVRTTEKTSQPCSEPRPDRATALKGTGECISPKPAGTVAVPICQGGFWWYRYYKRYECRDGSIRIIGDYFREERTQSKCEDGASEVPPPPPNWGVAVGEPKAGAPIVRLPGGCDGRFVRADVVAECDELTGYWVWTIYSWYRCSDGSTQYVRSALIAPTDRRCDEPVGSPPEWLGKYRDAMTGTGAVPTPTGAARTLKTIGLVFPRNGRPGETLSGRVVEEPKLYAGVPALRTVEIQVPVRLDVRGKTTLEGLVVDLGDGPQRAEDPVTVALPSPGRRIPVSIGQRGDDAPPSRVDVPVDPPRDAPPSRPRRYEAPPVCPDGGVHVVRGPLSGDARATHLTLAGKAVTILAETPRAAYWVVPAGVAPGPSELSLQDGPRHATFRVSVLRIEMGAAKLNLVKGESTKYRVGVLGAEAMPEAVWACGRAWDDVTDLEAIRKLKPGFQVPGASQPGFVLLTVENRSPDTIAVDGLPLVAELRRADFPNGRNDRGGTIQSIKSGGFRVYGQIDSFLCPLFSDVLADEAGGGPADKSGTGGSDSPKTAEKPKTAPTPGMGLELPLPKLPSDYWKKIRKAQGKRTDADKETDPERKKQLQKESDDLAKEAEDFGKDLTEQQREAAWAREYRDAVDQAQMDDDPKEGMERAKLAASHVYSSDRALIWRDAEKKARAKAEAERHAAERFKESADNLRKNNPSGAKAYERAAEAHEAEAKAYDAKAAAAGDEARHAAHEAMEDAPKTPLGR